MRIDYKAIKEKKVLKNQKEKLLKREEKFFYKKENEYINSKLALIREKL